MDFIADFIAFLLASILNLITLMSGVIGLMIDWIRRRYGWDVPNHWYIWIVVVCLMFGMFSAWREEHGGRKEQQTKIDSQAKELKAASSAKQEVARLQGEIEVLRKQMLGRHLSKEEERELLRTLSALGPHGVIVAHENGDAEAHSFAESLVAMFKSIPGWQVGGSAYMTQLGPRETGVILIVSDQGEVPQAVAIVEASLKREEIAFSLRRITPTPENFLGPRIFKIFVRSRS